MLKVSLPTNWPFILLSDLNCGNRFPLGLSGPDEVNGNTEQHDDQSGHGVLRFVAQQYYIDEERQHDVDSRKYRVSKCFVGTLRLRTLLSQDEQAENREDIEDKD